MSDLRILNVGQAVDVFPDQLGRSYQDLVCDPGPSMFGPYTFPSYDDGFRTLLARGAVTDYRAVPFLGLLARMPEAAVWDQVSAMAREMEANVVFLHFFHHPGTNDPRPTLESLRRLPSRPLIAVSCGDPLYGMLTRPPWSFVRAARVADVTFLTGMGSFARYLVACGAHNLVYLPHGSCQLRFENALRPGVEPEFDVCFIGNGRLPRNPLKHYFYAALKRNQCIRRFARRFGRRLAVFGNGWDGLPSWQGSCGYGEQQAVCRRSRVVIGGLPNAYFDYYMSDRPFIAVGSGRPFVDWHLHGVEAALAPGQDWFLVHSVEEYLRAVERLLDRSPSELDAIGMRAAEHVRQRHTTAHRSASMTRVFRELVDSRRQGRMAVAPTLESLGLREASSRTHSEVVIDWRG